MVASLWTIPPSRRRGAMNKVRIFYLSLGQVLLTAGCLAGIAFQDDASWAYRIDVEKIDTSVLTIISHGTLDGKYYIRSFWAGPQNSWEVEAGRMLDQVAHVELPQMFSSVVFANTSQGGAGDGKLLLSLDLESYEFSEGQ